MGDLTQEIKVFALAIKYEPGRKKKERCMLAKEKYLVLTFSPLASYSDVVVTIPGYGDVTVSSSPEGDITILE